jgi:TolB protein
MRRTSSALAALLMVFAGATIVRAQPLTSAPSTLPPIQIVGAEQVAPIAVSALKNIGGDDDHRVSEAFTTTLDRDLKLSGYFRLISSQAYVEDAQTSGYDLGQFNFADWSSINTEFLVKGSAKRDSGQVQIEVLLFDVGQQRRMMGEKYSGAPSEVGEMARRYADAVMQSVTGTRGPFATRLAFVSNRGGRFKEVYTQWLDGSGENFRVTDNPTINLFPSFDKSGEHLLYLSYKSMSPSLYLVDTHQRVETRIDSATGMAVGGAVTPDGRIVGAFSHGGATNLELLDGGGAEIRRLTDNHAINVSPSVCSGGSQLAFTSDRTGTPQIYVMGLDGGEAQRVTFKGDYNTAPAFSPDCKKIAYEMRSGGGIFQIMVVGASGGEPRQLTSEGSSEGPTWSPDGRYIAFSSRRGGRSRIYMMLAADGKITGSLTQGDGNDTNPSWSWWIGG